MTTKYQLCCRWNSLGMWIKDAEMMEIPILRLLQLFPNSLCLCSGQVPGTMIRQAGRAQGHTATGQTQRENVERRQMESGREAVQSSEQGWELALLNVKALYTDRRNSRLVRYF